MTYDEVKDGGDIYVRLKSDPGTGVVGYLLNVFPLLGLTLVVGLVENGVAGIQRMEHLVRVPPPKPVK